MATLKLIKQAKSLILYSETTFSLSLSLFLSLFHCLNTTIGKEKAIFYTQAVGKAISKTSLIQLGHQKYISKSKPWPIMGPYNDSISLSEKIEAGSITLKKLGES